MFRQLRDLAGSLIKDWRRYRRALDHPGTGYLALCNRGEQLEAAPDGHGYRCTWKWTSDLYAPKHLPRIGLELMRRALDDHPIRLSASIETSAQAAVSFVIGHRGASRLPQLLLTLESIAGQEGVHVECIVVEQDELPRVRNLLPNWVRYVHTPLPRPDLPYSRAWTFNAGVELAQSEIVVLHDNDMLVPRDYAINILRLMNDGFEVLNLKRFIFYLTESHTRAVLARNSDLDDFAPEVIVQNLEGGGSIAITRSAFDAIGGFDEAFVGWGGEDVEFWERASTRRVWPYAFMPLVHLWHQAQPEKHVRESDTIRRYYSLSGIPALERIARLRDPASRTLSKAQNDAVV